MILVGVVDKKLDLAWDFDMFVPLSERCIRLATQYRIRSMSSSKTLRLRGSKVWLFDYRRGWQSAGPLPAFLDFRKFAISVALKEWGEMRPTTRRL